MKSFTTAYTSKLRVILLVIFTLLSFFSPGSTSAQTPGLSNVKDIINSIDPDETSTHEITFSLPLDSQQIIPTDYIAIRFDHYSNITAPASISGTYTGTPTYQINGKSVLISGITVVPGSEISIHGIQTTNPPTSFNFYVILSVTQDFAGLVVKNFASAIPILYDGLINVSAVVGNPTAQLQISGLAGPYSYVIFNEGLVTLGTAYTAPNGIYSRYFSGIPGGTHSMSFYGIDQQNRNTSTISVDINTPIYQRTTLTDQLLSPTIQVDDVVIDPGDPIYATGSAAPNTTISVFTDSPLRSYATTASSSGYWSYTITDSGSYSPGDYRIYTLAQTGGGIQSIFSPAIQFTIGVAGGVGGGGSACGDITQGDLNCDASVNLIDFSILMYWWGTASQEADINLDSSVSLIDFSIMMYYWGS